MTQRPPAHRLSVAPMMDWTDRNFRYFARLLSRHTLLYTEMVTTGAVLHGNRSQLLGYSPEEHPLALQLGGDDPEKLSESARVAEDLGYDEVNLNVGCPSDRVQQGHFGACLMLRPERVAEAVYAMKRQVSIPVTVKHRLGVDDQDSQEALEHFVRLVAEAGCKTFIVHARKAILSGLSPKENRAIPPLRYEAVHQLKEVFPDRNIILNGGVKTLDQVSSHLPNVDGVMLGRAAYHTPYTLAKADHQVFGDTSIPVPSRDEIVIRLIPYAESIVADGQPISRLTRHLHGLYRGETGARIWRRRLTELSYSPEANAGVLLEALQSVREAREMDRTPTEAA